MCLNDGNEYLVCGDFSLTKVSLPIKFDVESFKELPPPPMISSPPNVRKESPANGFSLVELLVVISILTLLVAGSMTAFRSGGSSQNVAQGVYEIAGLLEHARGEAVTRQTYVWVGFENLVEGGQSILVAGSVCSRDGSAGSGAANLLALSRGIRIPNLALAEWNDLKQSTRDLVPQTNSASLAGNGSSIQFKAGRSTLTKTLTFTPRGEVMLVGHPDAYTPFEALIDVSFRQTRGTEILPEADDAALLLDGGTGTLKRIRVQ